MIESTSSDHLNQVIKLILKIVRGTRAISEICGIPTTSYTLEYNGKEGVESQKGNEADECIKRKPCY